MTDESYIDNANPEGMDRLFAEILAGQEDTGNTEATGRTEIRLERPGQSIGRYKLLEKIGEGGFGVVYAAQQRTPVTRRVALKIIKPGMDSKQVIGRFEAERQALALMDHANIAKVLDAGTTESGRPYFVMELVRGVPITEYCDREKLTTRERLDLFIPICHAIQHAHQKGVIHRDLKPSNILVTLHDGTAVPKVIDFGIAKATQQELTDKTVYTHVLQFIGTPAYMSPEQAEMTGLDIDTRSDVYSLGVLLYELLTGKTPFDSKELLRAGQNEIRRRIREEEPPRPSTRISRLIEEEVTTISRQRKTEPIKLAGLLKGDLDWIVMKCLEKDRARRYETANGLAMDIQRHLTHEPVAARPPSVVYRLQKAVRRNKLAFAAAGVVTCALLIGLVMSTWGQIVATRARLAERRLNFNMAFDRGLILCDQDHVATGMLWLAQALALAPADEPDMQRVIRSNLSAWRQELHTLEGIFPHDLGVVTAVFSPDGRRVLTGGDDGIVQLWDRQTGERVGTPLKHDNMVHECVFSPDGETFMTASYDGTARLGNAETGRHLRTLQHESSVLGVRFTPKGNIVTASARGRVRIWDVDTPEPIDELPRHPAALHDLVISRDGQRCLTPGHDGVVTLWDLANKEVIARFHHDTLASSVCFIGPEENRIASSDRDGNVFIWEWAPSETPVEGYRVGEPWRHRGGVHRVRANADGTRLLTASFDNDAQFLNAQTGNPIGVPIEHLGAVQGVDFSRDGYVLTASEDKAARLWRPAAGSLLREVTFESQGSSEALFTRDGRYVFVRGAAGTASVFNTETGQVLGEPFQPSGGVYAFDVSPDEAKILTGGADARTQFWEAASGRPFGEPFEYGATVWSVAISRDGRQALTAATSGVIHLWDAQSGTPIREVFALPHGGIWSAVFHPLDPSRILAGSFDNLARLIDVRTGEVLRRFEDHDSRVMVTEFSPDGKRIMTGSWDNTMRVWDTETGQPVSQPMRNQGPLFYFSSFSTDGSTIVIACEDGTARIWDVATSKPIGPKLKHETALRTATFQAGGTQIMTGTAAGTARYWSVSSTPMQGDVQLIELWLQVVSGMALDPASGNVRVFDVEEWQARRERLQALGGPPEV